MPLLVLLIGPEAPRPVAERAADCLRILTTACADNRDALVGCASALPYLVALLQGADSGGCGGGGAAASSNTAATQHSSGSGGDGDGSGAAVGGAGEEAAAASASSEEQQVSGKLPASQYSSEEPQSKGS